MAYLDSSKINVYPSGYRGNGINPESFVNSEQNLNEIASRLTSEDSYIAHENGVNIEFVIKGYLFKALKSDVTGLFTNPSNGTIIYASVNIVSQTADVTGGTYNTLIPYDEEVAGILDVSNEFKGVSFDTTSGDLSLYKYDDDDWNVIEDSMMTFSTKRIKDRNNKCINDEFTTTKLNVTGSASDVILPDKSINTNEIDDLAITTDKIADNAVTKDKLAADVFMAVFPVGSIYMSVNSTDPSILFPGTEWSQIQGQFLLGAGTTPNTQNTYTVNTSVDISGGNASYTFTLTEDNLPEHTHDYNITTDAKNISIGGFSYSGTTDGVNLSHEHEWDLPYYDYGLVGSGDTAIALPYGATSTQTFFTTSSLGTHSHTFSGTTGSKSYNVGGQTATGTVSSGGGVSQEDIQSITVPTMPPYFVVYIWRRTA